MAGGGAACTVVNAPVGFLIGAVIRVTTWVLPATFMVAMAWGCETHARRLGQRALLFYDGDADSARAAIAAAKQREDRGHGKREILRATLLALSIAIPSGSSPTPTSSARAPASTGSAHSAHSAHSPRSPSSSPHPPSPTGDRPRHTPTPKTATRPHDDLAQVPRNDSRLALNDKSAPRLRGRTSAARASFARTAVTGLLPNGRQLTPQGAHVALGSGTSRPVGRSGSWACPG